VSGESSVGRQPPQPIKRKQPGQNQPKANNLTDGHMPKTDERVENQRNKQQDTQPTEPSIATVGGPVPVLGERVVVVRRVQSLRPAVSSEPGRGGCVSCHGPAMPNRAAQRTVSYVNAIGSSCCAIA